MPKKIVDSVDEALGSDIIENDSVGADSSAQATEVAPTVAMQRDYDETLGGPTTADVHPDEVDGYLAVGWIVKDPLTDA